MLSFVCRAFVLISITSLAAEVFPPRRFATADVFDKPIVFSIRGLGTDSLQDLATAEPVNSVTTGQQGQALAGCEAGRRHRRPGRICERRWRHLVGAVERGPRADGTRSVRRPM